eukprot:GHVQ01005901.1.p2 GENE.GHVQ01005901.1~~GHVQ01005901.1.p2  ORF type:complete len:128 (+),score=9.42 GHVQ01005901.1:592-975(+)
MDRAGATPTTVTTAATNCISTYSHNPVHTAVTAHNPVHKAIYIYLCKNTSVHIIMYIYLCSYQHVHILMYMYTYTSVYLVYRLVPHLQHTNTGICDGGRTGRGEREGWGNAGGGIAMLYTHDSNCLS